jgi:hypothetical protein
MLAEIHESKTDDMTVRLVRSIAELAYAKDGDLGRTNDLGSIMHTRLETFLDGAWYEATAYSLGSKLKAMTMPEDGGGWHRVNAGLHLHIMFHPNRQLLGRESDDIERPSIVVAVAGKREQALRFDPFSVGSHYHIRPSQRGRQLPLWVEEGQKPLDVALAFFEKPLRFRGLLAQAEEDGVASQLDDADLASAARQIRELHAAAGHMAAA